jgi:hypothetical protein
MKALHIFSNLVGKTLFLPAIMVLLALTTSLAQAPANDLCSTATPIACGQTVTGSTLNATIDQAPVCTGMTIAKYGVWHSFAGNGERVTLSTCGGASWDTQIGVYSGSCAALVCVAGNNNACGRQSRVTFLSAVGTTYYIWVTGVIDARGNYSLSATCVPANDACADAATLACGATVTGSTANATGNDHSTTCTTSFSNTMKGVWYNLTPDADGDVTVSLCGSGYDTKLGVFTGACGALSCVAGNDDFCGLQSEVTFAATAGTTYRILVSGFGSASGSFTLTATCPTGPPPPPPACTCSNTTAFGTATAPALSGTPTTISTCNYGGERATINGAVAGNTYVFTSSNATDYLTVRSGTPDGPALGCGTMPLTVTATASGTIYLHISTNAACGTQNTCRTTTVACSSCPAPPPPSGCATATAITCGGPSVTGTTVGGSIATTLGTCTTSLNTAPGRWHTITPTQSGSVTVSLCNPGTNYDTKMGVFSGTCTALVCVGGNDDSTDPGCQLGTLNRFSKVTFAATAGTTYYIYVTGFSTNAGNYELSATCTSTLTAPTNTTAELAGEVVGLPEGALTVGQVFPNPLVGRTANIRVDSPKETEAIVRFMDQMGREVMMIESDLNVGDNLLQLNISRLPAGTYFVMVQVEGKVIPRRLVVPKS